MTPWDSNGLNTPHAHGDYDSNTATSYGLMLAYNQFSSSSVLSSVGSQGGGLGRKGAQRLLILETDGMANQASTVTFVNSVTSGSNPTNNSYYNIGGNNASTSSARPLSDAINVATKICALTTDTVNGPGFATPTKSVILHCIAFGALFEPDASGSRRHHGHVFAAKPFDHRRHRFPILGDRYHQSVLLQDLHRHLGAKTIQAANGFHHDHGLTGFPLSWSNSEPVGIKPGYWGAGSSGHFVADRRAVLQNLFVRMGELLHVRAGSGGI